MGNSIGFYNIANGAVGIGTYDDASFVASPACSSSAITITTSTGTIGTFGVGIGTGIYGVAGSGLYDYTPACQFCPECKTELNINAKFCSQCGLELKIAEKSF